MSIALTVTTWYHVRPSRGSKGKDIKKICVFKSHSALVGCSRCLKKFPGGFGKKRDYSGFDRNSWSPRTNEDHRRQATKISRSKTKAERKSIGQSSGISHYSVLLELEYFDIIRFCTVDPMHNLFLGTSKKMFQLWNDLKLVVRKYQIRGTQRPFSGKYLFGAL